MFVEGPEKDGSSLSSWARYLKNKYGNRAKDAKDNNLSTPGSSGTSSTSRRLSLGLPFRPNNSTSVESSDDDQKNLEGSPNSPIAATAVPTGKYVYINKYMQTFYVKFSIRENTNTKFMLISVQTIEIGMIYK